MYAARLTIAAAAALLALSLLPAFAGPAFAGGWYLMVPPEKYVASRPVGADTSAPLGQWTLYDVFDTARACKKEEAKEDKRALALLKTCGATAHSLRCSMPFRMMAEQCIATDDPRLKSN